MVVLENAFYLIVTIGILVFVHELGHFIAAKLCGMRVDRFSIGFPPRAFGKKIGDTDYCVSWVPFGGYVKIAGMVDESMDVEFLEHEPQSWEFRAKPVWQRMIVISAGVIMNLLLAIVIFWMIAYSTGRTVWETTEIGYVVEESPAARGGLKAGDRIIKVNSKDVANWQEMFEQLYTEAMGGEITFTVVRGTQQVVLAAPRPSLSEPTQTAYGLVAVSSSTIVGSVEPGMPADKLGLKPLDTLLTITGVPIRYDQRVRELVKQNAGKTMTMEWKRGADVMSGSVTPTPEGRIGIGFGTVYSGPKTRIQYSLLEALPLGAKSIWTMSVMFIQQIGQMVTGKIAFTQSVGGPIKIAQLATQSSELGFLTYMGFLALLSINLALLNILPFPALDGGHLAFLVYEGIFRKEVPVKVKLGLQKAGIAILFAFMIFVVANDIFHF